MTPISIFVIGTLVGISIANPPCPLYVCLDKLFSPVPSVCMLRINDSLAYVSNECPATNQVCPVSELNQIAQCATNTKTSLKPGELADSDSECYSGSRDEEGFCVGKLQGEICSSDIDCDVGYYCGKTSLVCEEAAEEGEACSSSVLCQPYLTCYENKCVQYGLLAVGDVVATSGTAKNCATRYMDSSTRKCQHGPKLNCSMFQTESNPTCNYTYLGVKVTDYPMCGFSSNGSLICKEKEGGLEEHWENLLTYMKQKPQCHVLHHYGFCERGRKVGCYYYLMGINAFYQIDPYTHAMLRDEPLCIKHWMFNDFWFPECPRSSGKAYMGISAFLFCVFLLLCL